VTWSSSNTTVATVNSATGVVSAIASGTANIIGSSEGQTGSASLTVSVAPVATVSVALNPASVSVGQTSQATAVTRDANNNVLSGRTVTWSSSNTTVATVNSATGVVTAIAAGTASIIGTSETKTGSASLTVTVAPVATVSVTLTPASVSVGQTSQATAVTRDANNNVLSGRTVTWSSSNTNVATVNGATGVVTAIAAGTASIIGTSETKTGSASLTVTIAPVAPVATVSVTLTPTSVSVGQTTQATAVTRDANNNVLSGRTVTWSSSNTNVATVNANTGAITTSASGTTTITGTSETKTGTALLTVSVAPVDSVMISLTDSSVVTGSTVQSTVVLRDANHNIVTGRIITYSSSDSASATVNASGLVSALAAGTVSITATSEGIQDDVTLIVTNARVNTVTVTIGQPTLAKNATTQAQAVLKDANNNTLSGRPIVWSSSDPSIASVTDTGVVTARKRGTASITATSETKSGSANVTVP
jgi:uncharacterized protein YjdB